MDQILHSESQSDIVLIIPAYEPDERFPMLLETLRLDYQGPILVVNDGSGPDYDLFYQKARELHCHVFEHHVNMGKGRALKNAFNYALTTYPDLIGCVTADSDGQHTPEDIYRCMDALREHPDRLILGCRDFSEENVPFRSRLGNNFMKKLCKYTCGVSTSDTQTGLRGIPASFMAELLNTAGERFEFETRMLIDAKDRYPLHEISIQTVYESKENHQSHYNTVKDSIRIGRIFAGVFLKFLTASLSSTVVDLLLFTLLYPIFKPMLPLYYVACATVLARIISAVYNYLINYTFVFRSREKHSTSAVRYFLLALIQMSLSALLTTAGVKLIPFGSETVIKAVVDVCLFFISFCIQRAIVFRR